MVSSFSDDGILMEFAIFRSGISPGIDTYLNGNPLPATHSFPRLVPMPGVPPNPDSRPLPRGWTEHFDSQRKLWYYIDLDANPPRVTFVHPYDERSNSRNVGSPPSSAATVSSEGSYTTSEGRRGSLTSTSQSLTREPSHRSRRATVAQQLYASSLSQASRSTVSTGIASFPLGPSPSSSRRPSISNSINSDETGSSATPLSVHSIPKAISSAPIPSGRAPFDQHDPRNFFDCTRLSRGTRRMTYSGPQPQLVNGVVSGGEAADTANPNRDTSPKGNVQALYHHTVASPPFARPRPSPHPPSLPQLQRPLTKSPPDRSANPASFSIINPTPTRINGFPPTSPSLVTPAIQPHRIDVRDTGGYTAITHDHELLLVPNPTDGRCWSPPPIDVDLDLQESGPQIYNPSPSPIPASAPPSPLSFIPDMNNSPGPIIQPKPTHPLNGLNLNLNQLHLQPEHTGSSMLSDGSTGYESKAETKRLGKFFKSFGFGSKTESSSGTPRNTMTAYSSTALSDDSFYVSGSSTRA